MSNGRATGRTFRAVLQALLFASEGKKVTFWSDSRTGKMNALALAKEISKGYASDMIVDEVIFKSGGLVRFTNSEGVSGYNINMVIKDD